MKGLLKGLMAGVILFFGMTLTAEAEDLPRMIMTPTFALNVRNAPSLDGQIVGSVYPGERVTAADNSNGWFLITYKDEGHFVSSEYLTYVCEEDGSYNAQHAATYGNGAAQPAPQAQAPAASSDVNGNLEQLDLMMVATAPVNMRLAPYGTIVNTLPQGNDIHVVGNLIDVGWYKCDYNGQTVYIHDDYLIPEFPQSMKSTVALNVRPTPNTTQNPIGLLQPGETIKVSGEENGWFKYTYDKTGQVGYSKAEYLTVVS